MEFETLGAHDGLKVEPGMGKFGGLAFKARHGNSRVAIGVTLPMSEVSRLHAYLGEVLAKEEK